jgi:hemolysin III
MTATELKQNEPMSALTHLIGALLSVAGLVLLVVFGALHGSAWHVVSFSIFGSFMILAYVSSTVYHYICSTKVKTKRVLQIFDHIAIYFLIAGTYTPVALVVLPPGWGWTIFGVIWVCAIIGTIIKATQMKISVWFSVLLYLVMGWLIVIAFIPLTKVLPTGALVWLVVGGVFYTIGAFFFSIDKVVPRSRWWGMHEVFHVFVMLGSFSHFWLFFKYVTFM